MTADVSDPNAAETVIQQVKHRWGANITIDILVANAGMTRFNLFDHKPSPQLTDWWRGFETNIRGTVSFIRAVLPDMLARKSGHMIPLASTSGSQDTPINTAYAASKAAVIKFNQDLGVGGRARGQRRAVNMEAAAQSQRMQGVFRKFPGDGEADGGFAGEYVCGALRGGGCEGDGWPVCGFAAGFWGGAGGGEEGERGKGEVVLVEDG
ncbi:MAG: hypothetical protein L6R38_002026 [Xanthoria sp. 2 TBL-2021]|nr:MAG: hypothetical protein L6R38_002026 [Xanthoria sp. 2 TBL-2021]